MKIEFGEARKTIGQHMLADGMSPVIDLEKSHGSWLVDGSTGKEYLDLFSMYASMSVGYNHPYVLENKERLTKASINKPANSDIYSPEMATFVETVSRVAQPDYMPYAFYIEGGALAVENTLKAAFDWKARKNLSMGKALPKNHVIHLKDCFHGRSGYTMSLTDSPDPRKVQYFPKFDWPRITNPSMIFPMNEENTSSVEKLEKRSIEELKAILHDNADDVACLILEPIQGEGGDNHFRTEYLSKLKELSLENDFLLIFDEVQTGVGITGKMWAHEHSNVVPDIMSFGKKTQCCGMFAGNRLNEVDNHVFKESSRINSTFGGNLVDMVRFTIYLELIEQEKLVQVASENGEYLLSKLLELQESNKDMVSNARGKGLFCAYDLPTTEARDKLITIMEDLGVIVLGCGHRSVRFRPHLNIKKQEIDIAISMMVDGLSKL
tara:strand:+ start:1017 stop:2327 length:1311 start_codon:yes stop_codon:yes gene_type:complete